jgi:hypothetical protein
MGIFDDGYSAATGASGRAAGRWLNSYSDQLEM